MSDRADLMRCWITFDLTGHQPPPPPGTIRLDGATAAYRLLGRGVGVTGYDEDDCLQLVADALGDDLPPVATIAADVDVSQLPVGAAEVGVPVWRGVWFPPLNREPGRRP